MHSQPAPSPGVRSSTERFFLNASLGSNRWWRWVLGVIAIILVWMGIGSIPWLVACQYLRQSGMANFSCDGIAITGDSAVPQFVLGFYPFIIGIIGVWLVIKLLHRKDLTQVVTGRGSFDYNRVLYAMGVGGCLYLAWFLIEVAVFRGELRFQAPNPWEYLTFFLFAIVLIPYQAAFEEIFFRGYILQRLILFTRNRLFLVTLSALLFVLPHLPNPEPWAYGVVPYVVSLMLIGGFLALVTLLDGGIELAVGYHALNNLFISLVANTEVSALESPSLFMVPIDRDELFPAIFAELMLYGLAFLVFNHKYKWIRLRR